MVGYFVVNIRNIRKGRANKRDWDHRPMAAATGAVEEKEKRDGCEGRPALL